MYMLTLRRNEGKKKLISVIRIYSEIIYARLFWIALKL